jgi:calpain-15
MYLNGEKTEIIVDDHLPVYKGSKDLAFSSSSNNDVWVQFLEKAWAKANGGYDKIVFGLCSEVLRAVTGAPTFTFDHDMILEDDLWKQLKDGVRSEYAMLCSLDSEKYNFDDNDSASNYSYTILGTFKVNTSNGNVKLVKIRNPWDNFEWKGDWSDSSRLWTNNIKEEVDFESNDKGIFYMSLQDYVENFNATVICKVHEDYIYTKYE